MIAIRRVYVYLLAFAGLLMLAGGVANLGRVVVEIVSQTEPRSTDYVRDQVSQWGAAALIGLPVWLIHWWWAQRLAAGSDAERSSTLRRLYLYAVLGVAAWASAVYVAIAIEDVLDRRVGDALAQLPGLVVAATIWTYTWRIADADRRAVGELGGSATLRRWYVYATAVVGLVVLLDGVRRLLETLWTVLLASGPPPTLLDPLPQTIVGLGLAVTHGAVLAQRFDAVDRRSTLRGVAMFVSLALAVGGTLFGLSQVLYYALGRALGVERPGGVGGSIVEAAAGPVSILVVYGVAWLGMRRIVRGQAVADEAPRQVGVRRLYTYSVALLSIAGLAVGVGGLLWTLGDALTQAPGTAAGDWWRDRVALFATLTVVSLPVWVLHWRPGAEVDAGESRSLARRLYAYLVLIASGLVLLFSAADAAYRLLTLALGASASASLASNLAHDLAMAIVAGLLVAHHAMTVRADARRAAPAAAADEVGGTVAATELWRVTATSEGALAVARAQLTKEGVQVEVAMDGVGRDIG